MRWLVATLFALLPISALCQLTPRERQGIADALFVGNMTAADLEFEKKPFHDKYRLPIVDLALDRPLDAADTLLLLHKDASSLSLTKLLRKLSSEIFRDSPETSEPGTPPAFFGAVPPSLQSSVAKLVQSIASANAKIRVATSKLKPDEFRSLVESLPMLANEEPSIKFDFVSTAKQLKLDEALRLLDRVDLAAIRAAGIQLTADVETELPALRQAAKLSDLHLLIKTQVDRMNVVIGGDESDVHTNRDAMLTIDLGGNDRYEGRHGAGIGYASVVIDLGGDDVYDVPDASIGCGLLGVGLAFDDGGNDVFKGRSLCFGAGLGGVGCLIKRDGNDSFSAISLCEGFGEFGIGVCLDTGGEDDYRAGLNAQGAARTQGVGWLIDKSGDDTYRCGGLVLNSPLFKDVHYSNGQGYASGYREDTGGTSGGVGLVTDLAGDDAYLGETYCQAASYWFSLASLYDGGGRDSYSAYHYAQSSAMHCTAAYLFDEKGDDTYTVGYGAAHAIGHDYGVAFLLDRAGNDIYSARDSQPGIGNANGLGIFVDDEGEDRYNGPPGAGNPGRGSGSLGVFVDLNGPDQYREGLADGEAAFRPTWGVAYDAETKVAGESGPSEPPATHPAPGSQALASQTELETIYQKATQWGVGTAQTEVGQNLDKLIGMGLPAFKWMVDKHLATADRLQLRAFTAVVNAVGDEAKAVVASQIASTNDDEARNALGICAETASVQAGPFIAGALKREALKRQAARAAGAVKASDAVPELMLAASDSDRLTALNALVSLSAISDLQSYTTGESLLHSADLPMRKAALSLVAKFPDRALSTAKSMKDEVTEQFARTAIELLGLIGSDEALEVVGPMLKDPRPGIMIQAMLTLNGRCPERFRESLLSLRRDTNELVRATAARIDPGR